MRVIRISVVFRGRAVPVVWKVLKHKSSAVAYEVYKELLDNAAKLLNISSLSGGQGICRHASDGAR